MWIEVLGLSCKCTTCLFTIAFLCFCHSIIRFGLRSVSLAVAIQLRRAGSQFIFKGIWSVEVFYIKSSVI